MTGAGPVQLGRGGTKASRGMKASRGTLSSRAGCVILPVLVFIPELGIHNLEEDTQGVARV